MVLNLYVVKNILVMKYLNKGKLVACKNNKIKSRIIVMPMQLASYSRLQL